MATDARTAREKAKPRPKKILRLEDYPTGDGKPMGETPLHGDAMYALIEVLRAYYADDPAAFVSGNMFVYYEEGDKRKVVAPDVYVSRNVPNKYRDVYFVWVEGKGPDFIIEVTSPKTRREDLRKKFELYRDVLKVQEYVLFDPRNEYLDPPLQGHRLEEGEYVPIPLVAGKLGSEVLGLNLAREGCFLRLSDPATGRPLLTGRELYQASEIDRREAEAQRNDLSAALKRSEDSRKAAEAEAERLRREIEALRRGELPS